MMTFFNTLFTRLNRYTKSSTETQEAVTFVQPSADGEGECRTMACKENAGKNLVVATSESRFSEEMMTYAIEMADRMDYGIIAVNAANLTHDLTEFFSTSREVLYQDFKETAERNVASFKEQAKDLGLKFAHVTKFSDVDHAVKDLTKECGKIEFIISENKEPGKIRGEVENNNRIAQRLCIYSIN